MMMTMAIKCSVGGSAPLSPNPFKQNLILPMQYKPFISEKLSSAAAPSPWEVQFPPNARRTRAGFTMGVEMGDFHTGVAISKGIRALPLAVSRLREERLQSWLLDLAEMQDVDEFIIGVPMGYDEDHVRKAAERLAVGAAESGRRVYLKKKKKKAGIPEHLLAGRTDNGVYDPHVYAAMKLLESYFWESGKGVEMLLPQHIDPIKIRRGRPSFLDYF